jgi:hypothetical protein
VVYGISYDPVETLERFASAHGITFSLLSDHGSAFIREIGLLNESSAPDSRAYGTPHPGTFVIDSEGRVTSKVFHDSNYIRDASATALRELLDIDAAAGPVEEWESDVLLLRASLDTGAFVRQRRVGWRVAISLREGLHVYGSPAPEGLVPTEVSVTVPEGVVVDGPSYPAPDLLSFPFAAGEIPVYQSTVEISGGLTFADIREDVQVEMTVRFQACTGRECFAPEELRVSLPIRYEPFA